MNKATKFEHILEKLHKSGEWKKFKRDNSKAFLCAGFFIIDYETKKREQDQIDYFIPGKDKIATFNIKGGKVEVKESDTIKKGIVPGEIDKEIKTEIDSLWQRVDDEMKNHNNSDKIQKLIAIVQKVGEKITWNITCMLSGLSILKLHLDDEDSSVLKFEKLNLFDFSSKGMDKRPDYVQ